MVELFWKFHSKFTKLAIKILSLTYSAASCEHHWNVFEHVSTLTCKFYAYS